MELDRGLGSYASLQRQLSAHVDTSEAYAARKLTNRSLVALAVGVIAVLFFGWLADFLYIKGLGSAPNFIATLAPIIISLVLVTRWRIPSGARIILLVAAVIQVPDNEWVSTVRVLALGSGINSDVGHYASVLFIGDGLLYAAIYGWLIDGICIRGVEGASRFRWSIYLTIFSIGAVVWSSWGVTRWQYMIPGALRMLLLVVWCWVLHVYFADPSRYNDSDVGIVFMMSMIRWGRRLRGRSLAICSLIVISVAALNGFALPYAFQLDGPDEAVLATFSPLPGLQKAPYAFFLPKLGRLLRASDFNGSSHKFYMSEAMPKDLVEELSGLELHGDYYQGYRGISETYWNNLSAKLEPWRIDGKALFSDYLAGRSGAVGDDPEVWILENSRSSRSNLSASTVKEFSQYFIATMHSASWPFTAEVIPWFLRQMKLSMLAAAIFSSLAFVTLWRRGGDSKAAQWIGVWLASVAMAFGLPLITIVFESTFVKVAGLSSVVSVKVQLQGLFYFLYGFECLLYLLTATGVTYWLVYWHIKSPVVRRDDMHSRAFAILNSRTILFAGAILTIVISQHFTNVLSGRWFAVCAATVSLAAIAGINNLRHRYGRVVDTGDARLKFGRAVYPFAAISIGLFLVAFLYVDERVAANLPLGTGWSWVAIIALLAFGVAALLFLLRTDWLRLSAGRNLSWLMTAFALPIIFEFTNNSLPGVFDSIGIFLPEASSIASILVVVALLQPLQKLLELVFEAISSPLVWRLRSQLDKIVENSLVENDEQTFRAEVDQLLRSHGIEHFTLWSRQRRCEFLPTIDCLRVANSVTLSKELCMHFAKEKSVIDLDSAYSEWKHFFYQFELHRLQSTINGRYIYPVVFCRSLWGFLVLEDSVTASGIAHNTFAETASELGVALSLKRK